MNQLLERLKRDFQDQEVRYAYADSVVNALISAQIKELREREDLSQEKLAELIGTKQSGISRLERADYSVWKIDTLRKLAKAFGVRLRIKFEEFGTLPADVAGFKKKNLLPRRFEDDPVFNGAGYVIHRKPRLRSPRKSCQSGLRRRLYFEDIPKKPAARAMYTPPAELEVVGGLPVHSTVSLGKSRPTASANEVTGRRGA